jgi:aminopeptidase N
MHTSGLSPSHYDVTLCFDDSLMSYSGSVVIQLRVNEPTDTIQLHSSRLEIRGVKLEQNKRVIAATYTAPTTPVQTPKQQQKTKKNKKKEQEEQPVQEQTTDQLDISLSDPLSVGKASLIISFKASVQKNDPTGIFHCRYNNSDYVITHFESHFARTAFPCFDEFHQRATFSLSLHGVPSNMTCISNTLPSTTQHLKNNTLAITFEKTPYMSPYLFAFVFGMFQHIEDTYQSINGITVPIRVFFPPDRSVSSADTVMEITKKALPLLENYFGVANDSKIDFVLVPKLFGGGMENWGCIFLMLVESEKSKQKKDDGFIELIIHELAHLWVGNLVAMPFYIKEGLAQYCEKKFGDVILGRTSSNTQSSFTMNKQASTAIIDKNAKKSDFGQVFNGLTYSASLGYVMEVVARLGEEEFCDRMRTMVDDFASAYMNEEQFVEICQNTY